MAHRNVSAKDLGLDVASGRDRDRFGWFLASYLFGKPIQQRVAERTWRVLVDEHGLDSPRKLCRLS